MEGTSRQPRARRPRSHRRGGWCTHPGKKKPLVSRGQRWVAGGGARKAKVRTEQGIHMESGAGTSSRKSMGIIEGFGRWKVFRTGYITPRTMRYTCPHPTHKGRAGTSATLDPQGSWLHTAFGGSPPRPPPAAGQWLSHLTQLPFSNKETETPRCQTPITQLARKMAF